MAGRGKSRGSRGGHADRTGPASSKGASRSANLGARSRGGRGTMGGFDPSAAPVGIGKNTGKGKSKGTSPLGGPGGKGTTSGKKGMRKSTWDKMSADFVGNLKGLLGHWGGNTGQVPGMDLNFKGIQR